MTMPTIDEITAQALRLWDALHPEDRAVTLGPNDYFEIASNNSPDPENDDDEVIEPQDYAGEYPLEGDDEADLD